ncbi:hypothetical protein SYNPS1DRAFT_28620 [Syncephalis pseudoplumigaleata]|uniref:Uncharacterized protein n=1 Tax=Syncephalis pseudoplumigaleata TaxID=1712513 RepID=A0A4P9YZP2_9FUNG|nr:hypothetical protein SYNPS1DRAFT_28620 [Syncephalis pseudoplumigaleata]|eukprot:RKP25653.1 hypothetical protein SYNPS1DRAFT_28620 [Syncephalis pseudoplumigaleata]
MPTRVATVLTAAAAAAIDTSARYVTSHYAIKHRVGAIHIRRSIRRGFIDDVTALAGWLAGSLDLWKTLVVQEYPRIAAEYRAATIEHEPAWRKIYRVRSDRASYAATVLTSIITMQRCKREEQHKIEKLKRRFEEREESKRHEAEARRHKQTAMVPPVYGCGPAPPSKAALNRMSVVQRLRAQSARSHHRMNRPIGPLALSLREAHEQRPTKTSTSSPPSPPMAQSPVQHQHANEETTASATAAAAIRVRTKPRTPGQPAISIRRSTSTTTEHGKQAKPPDKAAANFFAILTLHS